MSPYSYFSLSCKRSEVICARNDKKTRFLWLWCPEKCPEIQIFSVLKIKTACAQACMCIVYGLKNSFAACIVHCFNYVVFYWFLCCILLLRSLVCCCPMVWSFSCFAWAVHDVWSVTLLHSGWLIVCTVSVCRLRRSIGRSSKSFT